MNVVIRVIGSLGVVISVNRMIELFFLVFGSFLLRFIPFLRSLRD
jgi:hypothetical protein